VLLHGSILWADMVWHISVIVEWRYICWSSSVVNRTLCETQVSNHLALNFPRQLQFMLARSVCCHSAQMTNCFFRQIPTWTAADSEPQSGVMPIDQTCWCLHSTTTFCWWLRVYMTERCGKESTLEIYWLHICSFCIIRSFILYVLHTFCRGCFHCWLGASTHPACKNSVPSPSKTTQVSCLINGCVNGFYADFSFKRDITVNTDISNTKREWMWNVSAFRRCRGYW